MASEVVVCYIKVLTYLVSKAKCVFITLLQWFCKKRHVSRDFGNYIRYLESIPDTFNGRHKDKSMYTLYGLQIYCGMLKGTCGAETMPNSEKIKPKDLAVVEVEPCLRHQSGRKFFYMHTKFCDLMKVVHFKPFWIHLYFANCASQDACEETYSSLFLIWINTLVHDGTDVYLQFVKQFKICGGFILYK